MIPLSGVCIDNLTGELVSFERQLDGQVKVKFPSPAPGLKSHSITFTRSEFDKNFTLLAEYDETMN